MKSRIIRHSGREGESRQEEHPPKSPQEDLLLHETLAKAVPVGIFHADADGKCLYVNDRWSAISGLTLEQALGEGWLEAIHPEDRKRIAREWRSVAKKGSPAKAEWRFPRPDGKTTWVYGQAEPIRSATGEVNGYVGTITDITRQKRTEETLRLMQFSLDHSSDAAFWLTPDGRFSYVSDASCRMLGYAREELLSMAVWDINVDFPSERWPGLWAQIKQKGSMRFESRHRAKDGRMIPVEIATNYLNFGDTEYSFAFVRDVSERKRVERELRDREERLRALLDGSPTHIFIKDLDGRYLTVNRQIESMLNKKSEDILGKTDHELFPKEIADELRQFDLEVANAGGPIMREEDIRVYGELRRYITWKYPLFDARGKPYAICGIATDITERTRAEQALRGLCHVNFGGVLC